MHPFLLTKLTEASKSQKNDSKFSTTTKTMTFQNLNMPPPLVSLIKIRQSSIWTNSLFFIPMCSVATRGKNCFFGESPMMSDTGNSTLSFLLSSHVKVTDQLLGAFLSLQSKGLWSFQAGGTKLERFLPKNQHTQRKLLNFENWVNGEVSKSAKIWLSKSIFYIKNYPNLSHFIFYWRISI